MRKEVETSIHPSIHPSFHPSIYLSISLSGHPLPIPWSVSATFSLSLSHSFEPADSLFGLLALAQALALCVCSTRPANGLNCVQRRREKNGLCLSRALFLSISASTLAALLAFPYEKGELVAKGWCARKRFDSTSTASNVAVAKRRRPCCCRRRRRLRRCLR